MKIRKKISFILLLILGFFKNTHLCQKEIIKTLESPLINICKKDGSPIFQIKYTTQIYKNEKGKFRSQEIIDIANAAGEIVHASNTHKMLGQNYSKENLNLHRNSFANYTLDVDELSDKHQSKCAEAIQKLIGKENKLEEHVQTISSFGIYTNKISHCVNIFNNRAGILENYINNKIRINEIEDENLRNLIIKNKDSDFLEITLYHCIFMQLLINLFEVSSGNSIFH